MGVALNVVQHKHHFASWWQLLDGIFNRHTINVTLQMQVRRAQLAPRHSGFVGAFHVFDQRGLRQLGSAKPHEHGVHCHAMQPRGKGGGASEPLNLAEDVQKNLLSRIFSLVRIP